MVKNHSRPLVFGCTLKSVDELPRNLADPFGRIIKTRKKVLFSRPCSRWPRRGWLKRNTYCCHRWDFVSCMFPTFLSVLITLDRNPYIQFMVFGMKGGAPSLRFVRTLEGARHVLLVRGCVIGYKTLDGDDTYPLLTYWPTGATVRLHSCLFSYNPDLSVGDIYVRSPSLANHCFYSYVFFHTRVIVMQWEFGEITSLPC